MRTAKIRQPARRAPARRKFCRSLTALAFMCGTALAGCGGSQTPAAAQPCEPVAQAAPVIAPAPPAAMDPAPAPALPSWAEGATRTAIVDFVAKVTTEQSSEYIPPTERIAVFDNDGTLWCEKPMYVQLAFALDRVKAMAPDHPEWKWKQPFKAAVEGDLKALAKTGQKGLVELIVASHAGMSPLEFQGIVKTWLATAKHPRYGRPYTELTYVPMVELLEYLRAHGFKTFIVSGGGMEFMRPWAEAAYGIPPEQVVGSSIKTVWETKNGKSGLVRQPEMSFVDDGPGKPVGIDVHIGRQPVFAAGNSDGDLQMLQYAHARQGANFQLLVHHTDAVREYAYDRKSEIGHLDKALDAAQAAGWTVVDMKNDWKRVFVFDSAAPPADVPAPETPAPHAPPAPAAKAPAAPGAPASAVKAARAAPGARAPAPQPRAPTPAAPAAPR